MPGEGEPQSGREPSLTIHPSWTDSASEQSTTASALQRRIQELLASHTTIDALAEFLDAEAFIQRSPGKNARSGSITTFDVRGFVDHVVRTGKELALPESWTHIDEVIMPPGSGGFPRADDEGGAEQLRQHIPRTRYLAEILSDLNLPYSITVGSVDQAMVRQEPYVAFYLPTLQRAVLACNEGGNATYVIFDVSEQQLPALLGNTKQALGSEFPTQRITYAGKPETWKATISSALMRSDVPPLRTELRSLTTEAPTDWVKLADLASTLGTDAGTIRNWMQPYLDEHPEWKQRFRSEPTHGGKGRRDADYLAPELVAALTTRHTELLERGAPPEGWMNSYEYARSRALDEKYYSAMQNLLRRICKAHPEWEGQFLARQQSLGLRVGVYYAPEALAAADELRSNPERRAEILDEQTAPPGWVSLIDIAAESGRAYNVIAAWADKELTASALPNSAKTKYYNPTTMRQAYYVSPELAAALKARIARTPFIQRRNTTDQ